MNKYLCFHYALSFWALLIFLPLLSFAQPNPAIQQYKESLHQDSLKENVRLLQNYQSRYAFHPNRKQIATSLKERLQAYGWETELDSFFIANLEFPKHSGIINNEWQYNVVAHKTGSFLPDSIFIIGAHYDSYANLDTPSTYFDYSPGADDNASGVSAVLEIARIYQKHNITPLKTIRLELYAAEETGLHGSTYAAQESFNKNEALSAMLCLDMIGHKTDSLTPFECQLISYDNSEEITALCQTLSLTYTDLIPHVTALKNNASDSYSYYLKGNKALFLHEQDFHPFYHSSADTLETLNFSYLKQLTTLAFALTYQMTSTSDLSIINHPHPATNPTSFQILENPVKDNIKLQSNSPISNQAQLFLTSTQGQVIVQSPLSQYQIGPSSYHIPVHSLPPGLYILSLRSPTIISTHKIIIY